MSFQVAILGAGGMGKRHAGSLHRLGASVTAVCDSSAASASALCGTVPGAKPYDCFDTMLAEAPFDALFICLPPFAHNGQFEKAAAAGKHLFIEKPIALTSAEGRSMARAARESGAVTQVGFHMRRGAAVKRFVELVESGEAGRPVLFNGQYECNSLHTPWWIHREMCGGQIFEQAIHIYDMCRYLMGDPKSVCGLMGNTCHNRLRSYTVEDVSASISGFANGAAASITATNCAVPGRWVGRFTVVYENVTAFFEDFNHATFVHTKDGQAKEERVEDDGDPYLDEVRDFLEAIAQGRAASCPISEGLQSLLYVETVVRSATMDGVKLPLE